VNVECPPETESLLGDLPEMARWKQMLTRDGINRVLRQALGVLPAAPVRSGERWTSSHQFESPFGTLAIATNYRYEGPRRLEQRIVQYISAQMETSVVDQDSPESLAERLRPKQQGIYYFDAAEGCLAESHLTQTVRSEVPYADTKIGVVSTGTLTLRIHHREN
jgi:hypothetical protein